ncbi:disease resistance protein At4g27190-like [Syzygium oleosum]|uniref:disease resistance protein At4g27190-like n=1 Tax=Syzygium oleosum TaxID=219896 RepID=UPI0024BB5124|nr:disease resistance protein At4g27190-like [Syzygium oleosum]
MKAVDDEKLKVIGVYGPGGVGKTTLLEEVQKKLRKEGRPFHMIIKAKVSQIPVLKNIQDEIADALKLDLKDVQSDSGRGNRLLERLQRDPSEKVLIILDDLWDKLDLKAVGIPSGAEGRGCKLLLSSRFKDVLEQKMLADRTFHLEGLSNDETFKLFEKMVGDRLKDEELKRIAAKVVKKLAGLPLLITSVASTLKYSGVSAWKNALIKIDESNIETTVKLSYDHLKSEDAKSLFLLCGLIGRTIRVEILLVLGMGLGLFEGFNNTIEDSRDRLNTRLDELRSACLLLDGGDDKDNVTIHDLYSQIVVSTPFRGHNSLMMNSNYGSWSKEKLEKCWAICQVDVGSDGLAELTRCGFPELKILMLSQPKEWDGRLKHRHDVGDCCRLDFTYMKELRVLYLSSMHIIHLPSSMEILINLRSLYLDNCDVHDVAILGKLKAL